jgi:hypothetical protein
MHVYNKAVSSLTGIPVAQLRAVSAADGLLPSTEEGFQVMLRYCEEEWMQQLKSGIENWLKFVIQNVNPALLGLSAEASQLQEQSSLPAVNQTSAAEILIVPEVRPVLYIYIYIYIYNIVHCLIFCDIFRSLLKCVICVHPSANPFTALATIPFLTLSNCASRLSQLAPLLFCLPVRRLTARLICSLPCHRLASPRARNQRCRLLERANEIDDALFAIEVKKSDDGVSSRAA